MRLSLGLHRLPLPAVVALIAIGASGFIVALRTSGALVATELSVFDRMLRASRPHAEDDPRVVIVQVTERDIQELGYPLSDELLARAVRTLVSAGARAIGVDLYRAQAT